MIIKLLAKIVTLKKKNIDNYKRRVYLRLNATSTKWNKISN